MLSRTHVFTALFLLPIAITSISFAEDTPTVGSSDSMTELFRQRVSAFDEEFKTLLSRLDMLDSSGQLARNLSSSEIEQVQQMFRRTLRIELPREDVELFSRRMLQDARRLGRDWQRTLSISKFHRASRASHGYLAEAISFDELAREFSDQRIQFTKASSKSADIVVMQETPDGSKVAIKGIQTKVRVAAEDALREGLDDAQTFYANKGFHGEFRVDIPKDQFEELVRKKVISPANGEILEPERFLTRLKKNADLAFSASNVQNGSQYVSSMRHSKESWGCRRVQSESG